MEQHETDEKFMRLALNEAQKALKQQEVPIGAVVVAGGAVIGRGHNLVETLADPTAHAEMQALTAAAATLGGKYLQELHALRHGRAAHHCAPGRSDGRR